MRDRIADAYLRRELAGGGRLGPAELAAEVGTSPMVARPGRPTDPERLAVEVELHCWTREIRSGQRLEPRQLARELGGDQRQISQQLTELRVGPSTAAERITQLWHAQQQDPAARPRSSSQLA